VTWLGVLHAMWPATIAALWFYAGHTWSHALRERPRAVVVPVDRVVDREVVPLVWQALFKDMNDLVFKARVSGPGMVAFNTATVWIDGAAIKLHLSVSSDQLTQVAEPERKR
jgi:hypothetical protein